MPGAVLSGSRGLAVGLLFVVGVAASVPAAAAERYEYDAAGRLVRVSYDDGSTITYTYDKSGNIVAIVSTGPKGATPTTPPPAAPAPPAAPVPYR